MRPLTAITGILLGSCFAITVSLAAVFIVFLVLADDYPRFRAEFRPLLFSLLIFFGMTSISAASFYSLLKNWRGWAWLQLFMWLGLVATASYYSPG